MFEVDAKHLLKAIQSVRPASTGTFHPTKGMVRFRTCTDKKLQVECCGSSLFMRCNIPIVSTNPTHGSIPVETLVTSLRGLKPLLALLELTTADIHYGQHDILELETTVKVSKAGKNWGWNIRQHTGIAAADIRYTWPTTDTLADKLGDRSATSKGAHVGVSCKYMSDILKAAKAFDSPPLLIRTGKTKHDMVEFTLVSADLLTAEWSAYQWMCYLAPINI